MTTVADRSPGTDRSPAGGNALTGMWALVRFILRRDRFLMPLWAVGLAIPIIGQVAGTRELFPTPEQQQVYAATLRTPALVALYGPLFDVNVGALSVTRAGFAAVVVAVVTSLVVIRHTRVEEEAGRRELLGSTVVGRHAGLAAALVATSGASLVLGAVITLGMSGQDLPVAGSVALGLAYAGVGIMFAAVGGLAAQLTQGANAARGIGLSAIGAMFVLRLAGDVSEVTGGGLSWLSWLSPIGWGQQVRPYAGERWWVLVLLAGFAIAMVSVALAVSSDRDVGAGVVTPRPGPGSAAAGLDNPFALAWWLHRGTLLAWSVGFVALGMTLGGVGDGIGDLVEQSPELEEVFVRLGGQEGLVDAYLAGMMGVLGLIASGYAIQAALRLRVEEAGMRAEPVLAASVSRLSLASSHLVFAAIGPAVVLALGGLATGVSHGLATGDVAGAAPRVLGGALVQLPAVWMLGATAIALFGLVPRLTGIAWGVFALFFFLGQLGSILRLDPAVLNLSPFTHVPNLPGGELTIAPLVWLSAVSALLTLAGLVGWRRRDLMST